MAFAGGLEHTEAVPGEGQAVIELKAGDKFKFAGCTDVFEVQSVETATFKIHPAWWKELWFRAQAKTQNLRDRIWELGYGRGWWG